MAGGVDVLSSIQSGPTNLVDATTNLPAYWGNNDTLVIPSTFAGLPIAIEDSASGLTPIAAAKIEVQTTGVTLKGETTSDELYVDPSNATSLVADSGDDMTITAAVAPLSSGTTVLNTTGNAGSVTLSGTASITTIDANASSLTIASGANITATTLQVNSGNLTVAGTLNATTLKATSSADTVDLTGTVNATTIYADAGTWTIDAAATVTATTINANGGAITIEGDTGMLLASPNVMAAYVNTYSSRFDVEGSLAVSGKIDIAGDAVLAGGNTYASIALNSGAQFVWESSVSGQFAGEISGSGSLTVDGGTGAMLTSNYNTYTGGTIVSGGTLQCGSADSIPNLSGGTGGSSLFMSGAATVDLNGYGATCSELTGGSGDTITNSSSTGVILFITGTTTSVFSGTIQDGNGGIEVWLISSILNLSGGNADYTGQNPSTHGDSTYLQGGSIILNTAQCSPDFLVCDIYTESTSTVTFYAPSGTSTFSGTLFGESIGSGGYLYAVKTGPGTLALDPDFNHQWNYTSLLVQDGAATIDSVYAISSYASGLDVEGGGTVNLGGLTGSAVRFGSVTLGDGTITNGAFSVAGGGQFKAEYGEIDASITDDTLTTTIVKAAYDGGGTLVTIAGVAADTVLLNGATMQVATMQVNEGTLEVGSALHVAGGLTSNITVNNAAILSTDADSKITGSITYASSATSTVNGQIDDSVGGATVTNGALVVTSPAGLADGSDLLIGSASLFSLFAGPTGGGDGESGEDAIARTLTSDDSDSDTGPITDNGLTLYQETKALAYDAFDALMSVRYPEAASSADLTHSQNTQIAGDFGYIFFTAFALNGNSGAAMPQSAVYAAIGQLLENMGKTATANDNTWTQTYNNPWGLGGNAACNFILDFVATHDIS